jgi:hypothetical protein
VNGRLCFDRLKIDRWLERQELENAVEGAGWCWLAETPVRFAWLTFDVPIDRLLQMLTAVANRLHIGVKS